MMSLTNQFKASFLLVSLAALTTSIFLLISSKTQAQRNGDPNCSIILSESGERLNFNPVTGFTGDSQPRVAFPVLDRAVSFIRYSYGPCIFAMHNQEEYDGDIAVYGGVDGRVRIGAEGAGSRGEGWRARSMVVFEVNDDCYIDLGDSGVTQKFYGPGKGRLSDGYAYLTGWDFVRETRGSCTFEVFNGSTFDGRSRQFPSGVNENIRVGWRIRSIRIRYN